MRALSDAIEIVTGIVIVACSIGGTLVGGANVGSGTSKWLAQALTESAAPNANSSFLNMAN
jgi:hypothetical protein